MGNASTLSNSFNGFRNAPPRRALVVGISYTSSPRVGCGLRWSDIIITGVENDLNALANWTSKFDMHTKVYHDGIKERQPKAHTVVSVFDVNPGHDVIILGVLLSLRFHQANHTFIVSGHGATINGENVYLPVDCIKRNQLAADKAISYSEMRTLLAAQSNAAPLVVVTDFCNSDNILQLPYVLVMEGDEPIWRETEYQGDKHRNSNSIIAHFSPGCQAGTWPKPSSCRMFTQGFFNVSPSEKLSLHGIMERLKSNVGQIRNDHDPGNGSYLHQQYKVYCSHKFDHAHFFDALGFKLSIAETCYGGTLI